MNCYGATLTLLYSTSNTWMYRKEVTLLSTLSFLLQGSTTLNNKPLSFHKKCILDNITTQITLDSIVLSTITTSPQCRHNSLMATLSLLSTLTLGDHLSLLLEVILSRTLDITSLSISLISIEEHLYIILITKCNIMEQIVMYQLQITTSTSQVISTLLTNPFTWTNTKGY